MLKSLKIRNELAKIIMEQVPNIAHVTGGMGIDFSKEKRFFEVAQKVAQQKKIIVDKNIQWVPIFIDPKTPLICGLRTQKDAHEEIALIEGLLEEIRFEFFLKEQLEKFIDPKSKFIKALLEDNDFKDFDQAIEKGDIIGVNLRSPQAVIIAEVPGLSKKIHTKHRGLSPEEIVIKISEANDAISKKISAGFKNYDQNIVGYIGPDRFVVLKWAKGTVNTLNTIDFFRKKSEFIRGIVQKESGLPTTVGAGQYYSGLSGLRKSYHDAECALDLGKKIWGEAKSYHIVDIGMFISLSEKVSYERKAELAYQILGEVIRDKDLHKTMKTFFELNMNLTDAAKKLHLHRNTLIYRLEKIRKELGLDPRKFSDAVQIKLGLLLYSPNRKECESDTPKTN